MGIVSAISLFLSTLGSGVEEWVIRHALLTQGGRFSSWHVIFRSDSKPESVDPQSTYLLDEVGARAPDSFYFHRSHGGRNMPPTEDIDSQCVIVTSNTTITTRPFRRLFWRSQSTVRDPLPKALGGELFFLAVGWWPFSHKPAHIRHGGTPVVFADVARHSSYRLTRKSDVVLGRRCHLFEWPNRDRLWLAAELGFALVVREHLDPNTGEVLQRLEMNDWREIQPGCWFPYSIRNIVYAPANPESVAVEPVDNTFRFLSVSVADRVDPRLFTFLEPPGSLQIAHDGSFTQTHPGGQDYLNDIVRWSNKYASASRIGQRETVSESNAIENVLIALLAISALASFWYRMRRARVPPANSG